MYGFAVETKISVRIFRALGHRSGQETQGTEQYDCDSPLGPTHYDRMLPTTVAMSRFGGMARIRLDKDFIRKPGREETINHQTL